MMILRTTLIVVGEDYHCDFWPTPLHNNMPLVVADGYTNNVVEKPHKNRALLVVVV